MENKGKDHKSFAKKSNSINDDMASSYDKFDPILANTHELQIVDVKVNKCYMTMLWFFSTIGGFLFGYDTSVIAGANLYVGDSFHEVTDLSKEAIVSSTLLGAAIGSIFGGPVSDKYGRRLTIFIADILFTTGWVVMALSPSIAVLVLGRFIVGLGVGIAAMVIPVYLAEVAPKSIRGTLINLNVISITSGQFIALLVCLSLGNRWRWMLGLAGVPSFLQGVGIMFLIESPRWLFKIKRYNDGINSIKKLYVGDEAVLRPVIFEQREEADRVKRYENIGYWNLMKQLFKIYWPWVFAGWGIQMFQQLCGINTAMYYGPEIMIQAGFGGESHRSTTLISALPLAGINAVGTIISLAFIDKLGRRWILLRTLPFIAFFMALIGLGMGLRNHTDEDKNLFRIVGQWWAASGLFFYLLVFSIGMGSTPWTINSEIYPLHLRGLGNSMSSTTNWVSNFIVAMTFLSLTKDVPYGDIIGFLIISMICIVTIGFVYFKIPETKGLSLDEVLALFVKDYENENGELIGTVE